MWIETGKLCEKFVFTQFIQVEEKAEKGKKQVTRRVITGLI